MTQVESLAVAWWAPRLALCVGKGEEHLMCLAQLSMHACVLLIFICICAYVWGERKGWEKEGRKIIFTLIIPADDGISLPDEVRMVMLSAYLFSTISKETRIKLI